MLSCPAAPCPQPTTATSRKMIGSHRRDAGAVASGRVQRGPMVTVRRWPKFCHSPGPADAHTEPRFRMDGISTQRTTTSQARFANARQNLAGFRSGHPPLRQSRATASMVASSGPLDRMAATPIRSPTTSWAQHGRPDRSNRVAGVTRSVIIPAKHLGVNGGRSPGPLSRQSLVLCARRACGVGPLNS